MQQEKTCIDHQSGAGGSSQHRDGKMADIARQAVYKAALMMMLSKGTCTANNI